MQVSTDIGGTFTDVVTLNDGTIQGRKVLSTPARPHKAITELLQTLGPVSSFSHSTTVATNAVLERTGAKTAFVTTEGFRDLLYIARQQRPRLYDFDAARPAPLVNRNHCFEAPERVGPDGTIISPLTDQDIRRLVAAVIDSGAEAVAICFLFSYKNPSHEVRLGKAFRMQGLPVSLSCEIVPEFREFERASTTTMNAFLQPVVDRYLKKIGRAIYSAGGPKDYYVMKSSGGVATAAEVHPVELILSGPAGGVSGALRLSQDMGRKNLITFDMGGTSADFSAIYNGIPLWTEAGSIDGLPVRLPTLDITTVGAGGGSIAWQDKGNALRVGPQSTGSVPGPACYDRGGTYATVTDANVLGGFLAPRSFAVTQIRLNPNRSSQALQTLARQTGLSLDETVLGVRSVVNANMLRGIRRATVEKGIDTRTCTLLAFGGAGPLHAAELAESLGVGEVIIPPMAGMFSALGILLSNARLVFSRTLLIPFDPSAQETIETVLQEFTQQAIGSFTRQNLGSRNKTFHPSIDLRYEGQSFHLAVPYDRSADMADRFHRLFEDRYGYCLRDVRIEIVSVKLLAIAERSGMCFPAPGKGKGGLPPTSVRDVLLPSGWRSVMVYDRGTLAESFTAEGPLIIEDEGCTIFVPPGGMVSIVHQGCLLITLA